MKVKGGRNFYGEAIGVIVFENNITPAILGDVRNALSYDFPVRFKVIKGISPESNSPQNNFDIDGLVQAVRELEQDGVRAIMISSGCLTKYLFEVASNVSIPILSTPLALVPMISTAIGDNLKVGIITENQYSAEVLNKIGINEKAPYIIEELDMDNAETYVRTYIQGKTECVDYDKIRRELVSLITELVKNNPDIGAIVLDGAPLASFTEAIKEEIGLPMADFMSLARMVYRAIVPQDYEGFM